MNRTTIQMTMSYHFKALGFCLLIFGLTLTGYLSAQTICTEVSSNADINHHHLSTTYLGGGAAFFDFDNDNDEDIWITGGLNMDALYRNNGDGTFTEIGMEAEIWGTNFFVTTGVITGDVDNDGFRDVLVLTHTGHRLLLFRNDGDGTFTEDAVFSGLAENVAQSFSAAFADVNLDGYLDIYVGNYIAQNQLIYDNMGNAIGFDHNCHNNWLFINNGDGIFLEKTVDYGVNDIGCALATLFTDYDNDRDSDLLVINDFGEWIIPNTFFQNEWPNDTFSNISQYSGMNVGIYGMGIAVGDYDRDLDLDYYVTNLGRNVFFENQNDGTFLDKSVTTQTEDKFMDSLLATGWGTAFLDIDNDTDLDLFVCNGYVPAADFIKNSEVNRNRLFINQSDIEKDRFSFSNQALEAQIDDGGRGRGMAYSDYDNDGDLDILIVNNNRQATPDSIHKTLLFRNDLNNSNNWLKVKLEGTVSNRDAYGAQIKIVVGEKKWLHDYNGGFGAHTSQHSSIAHFGLEDAEIVDSLIIYWPSGEVLQLDNLLANQFLKIKENDTFVGTNTLSNSSPQLTIKTFPNPFSNQIQIQFSLPQKALVKIAVYDRLGRSVKNIAENQYSKGQHSLIWQPTLNNLPAGKYWIRLDIDHQLFLKNVIFVNN